MPCDRMIADCRPLRILIIDDWHAGFGAGSWKGFCDEGCDIAVCVVKKTIPEFVAGVRAALAAGTIHGAILDINLGLPLPLGGIQLYEELERQNLAQHMGRILVTTIRAALEPVELFVDRIGSDLNTFADKGTKSRKFYEWRRKLRRVYQMPCQRDPGNG